MIGRIVKKIFVKNKPSPTSSSSNQDLKIRDKSKELAGFLQRKIEQITEEFSSIKEKCQDLQQTNYDLGIKHLENGRLPEAIIRFRIIKKFWPDNLDAKYQLAYCLSLKDKFNEAKQTLEELLEKSPNYDSKARDLLNHVNGSIKKEAADSE